MGLGFVVKKRKVGMKMNQKIEYRFFIRKLIKSGFNYFGWGAAASRA